MTQMSPMPAAFGPPIYSYLVVHLETAGGRPEEAEAWMRQCWSPSPRWTAETVGKRYFEMLEKKLLRLALLDGSNIITVAMRSDTELRCLHCLDRHEAKSEHGGLVEGFADEASMLLAFRNLLDRHCSPETLIVGHNLLQFDLPRLRHSMMRHGIRLPEALAERDQPTFDSMAVYGRRFTTSGQPMISLEQLLEKFGIESHKELVKGGDVPALFEAKQFDLILKYSLLDVLAEEDAFLRMTGRACNLK